MSNPIRRFTAELRRRKVDRTAIAYLAFAFVVVQVVDAVFPLVPWLPEWAGTFVLGALVVLFPVVLVLSWVLELTPKGLRRELSAEEAARPPARALRDDAVAVLPFENLSPDAEGTYFSDGVTDDIIAAVARIPGLKVLARTSVVRYRDQRLGARQIAEELGVATIVSGSIRTSGTRVRILSEVVDARSDHQLWTDTYDRELSDIFAIQEDVAARVAEAVHREMSAAGRAEIRQRGTSDSGAYDLYLRGRHLWNQRSGEAVEQSIGYFERAIERDPSFALAHAGLADAKLVLGIYGQSAPAEVMTGAHTAAQRAVELDPALGEAMASLGTVQALHGWAWGQAEQTLRAGIAASPSYATGYQWYAMNLLAPLGRFAEAERQLDTAAELDAESAAIAVSRGILAFYARDFERALGMLDALVARMPGMGLAHYFRGQALEAQGDASAAAEALAVAVQASAESSETLAAAAHALGRAGREEEARAIAARLENRAERRYVSAALRGQVALGLGERAEALALLEEAAEARATDLVWLGVRPVYDPLREEGRFQALLGRVGLG